jgi:sporulation protein YlmC with PRC-barrel domain
VLAHGLPEARSLSFPPQWPDRIFGPDARDQFHSQEHHMNDRIDSNTIIPNRLGARVLSASTLSSDDVYNKKGERLGSIKELMLDIESGKVCYAVLSFGGFLSLGEKLFAVPWSALTVDTDSRRIVMDADEERLKKAPGFDADHWPNMADPGWEKSVHTYYGTTY